MELVRGYDLTLWLIAYLGRCVPSRPLPGRARPGSGLENSGHVEREREREKASQIHIIVSLRR